MSIDMLKGKEYKAIERKLYFKRGFKEVIFFMKKKKDRYKRSFSKLATTYFPGQSPTKYHQRMGA